MKLIQGDCLEVMRTMDANSVDAIVTDPPAGISFMGKDWDKDKGGRQQWIAWMTDVARECLRVVKPGGHALVWAIPRTSHWTGMAWEDAGWEPRDKIFHAFGSGFPKSQNISVAIDKLAGAEGTRGEYKSKDHAIKRKPGNERMHEGYQRPWRDNPEIEDRNAREYIPATEAAKRYEGYGTALKPAVEEWWLFRKPVEGTIAANVLKHGTGGLNIDGCRVSHNEECRMMAPSQANIDNPSEKCKQAGRRKPVLELKPHGRYPANLILSDDPEVLACFPVTTSGTLQGVYKGSSGETACFSKYGESQKDYESNTGSAARFFKRIAYFSKASKRDRDEGCEGLDSRPPAFGAEKGDGLGRGISNTRQDWKRSNHHPTVKPTNLMRYLCKLITPPNGIILDPFAGSGSTGKAAMMEGFQFIGIEKEAEYIEIAKKRIDAVTQQLKLF